MKIDRKVVENVANLARLEFDEEEKELYVAQLNSILTYMEKLDKLDTTEIPPTSHAINLANVFREDLVIESLGREKSLDNAPEADRGFFKVPKIIE
ncbi:MAG: Asp-tRNA(Asn)/Glu-tRNA(Gln) amidotransferase subunit GatC [Desulfatiglandales bacterium]